jgi:hypothetical protein
MQAAQGFALPKLAIAPFAAEFDFLKFLNTF